MNGGKDSSLSKANAMKSTFQWHQYKQQLGTTAWIAFAVLWILLCIDLLVGQIYVGSLWRSSGAEPARSAARVVSCYYTTPQTGAPRQLLPATIHPDLCTHINVAFAEIKDKRIYLADHQYESLAQVVSLKKKNPELKVLLSVGGAGSNSGFPAMVADHASRKVFIRSIKTTLRNYSLDGIDLDWEFPVVHNLTTRFQKRERQHFSQLLREIRMEYMREKREYLLTVAVAAQKIIADAAYDVDQINMYVDYVNIMTYDFHFYTEVTPFTGLNAPLYARTGEQLYMATLNINYTVHMYMDKGLDRNKIVVGIPTYGHTFQLVNSNNGNVGSPALGYGDLGQQGFVNYPEVCHFIKTYDFVVTVNFDLEAKVPYLHRDFVWASFDNPKSVMAKAKYITENDLRGAMVYSLNADDYEGTCDTFSGGTKFPLAESIRRALND